MGKRYLRSLTVALLLGLVSAIFTAQGTDGVDDVGVFRPSARMWYYDYDHDGTTDARVGPWAEEGDLPVVGDFDGDGADDVAVFRPSTSTWYYDYGRDGTTDVRVGPWAVEGDLPVAGDFDGDGIDDVAVFRPTSRIWYYDYGHDGSTDAAVGPWAEEGDLPIAGDFDGDGIDDVAVFRPSTGTWYYDYGHNGTTDARSGPWGLEGDLPIAGDFDGDGIDDVAVFRPSTQIWYFDYGHDGTRDARSGPWGKEGDLPIAGDFDGAPSAEPGPGPSPGPVGGEIALWVDRGCGPGGTSYNLGDPIVISYQVGEAGTAVLYDFDPYVGAYGRILTRQLGVVLPGVEHHIVGRISAARGVETLVLRVMTTSGRVLQDACSFSIGGVSTELVRIWTNKGCGAGAVFHHRERATIYYSVGVAVTRVRIYGINPQMGLVELTPAPLIGRSGQLELTVGPQLGDAVLVVAAVTPTHGVITSSCWVHMG